MTSYSGNWDALGTLMLLDWSSRESISGKARVDSMVYGPGPSSLFGFSIERPGICSGGIMHDPWRGRSSDKVPLTKKHKCIVAMMGTRVLQNTRVFGARGYVCFHSQTQPTSTLQLG